MDHKMDADHAEFKMESILEVDLYILHCPPPETRIWRYMDVAKFISMLANGGLFFCSIPELSKDDKWEAAFPLEFLLAHRKGSPDSPLRHKRKEELERTFLNCWHENPYESAAMWKLYSAGAYTIAICSTVQQLKNAPEFLPGQVIDVHLVEYIDYSTEPREWNNLDEPLFTKRKSFKHECEIRARLRTEEAHPDTPGLVVPTNLAALIETVYVSPHDPPWFDDVVKSLLDKYGFGSIPVKRSQLNEPPTSI